MSDDDRELPGFSRETFGGRRSRALDALGRGAMVLTGAAGRFRAGYDEDPYRPDPDLFYLTGVDEPGCVAVLRGFADTSRFVLFVRPDDPTERLWLGPRMGPSEARERVGADACYPLPELYERLPELVAGADRVHFRLGSDDWVQGRVEAAVTHARRRGSRTGSGPRGVVDPGLILDEMRLRKDVEEQEALRRAAELSVTGHRALARALRGGAGEWELEAAIDAAFRGGGASGPAYESIVASGPNACVLHYRHNHRRVRSGDLVLVDAAARLEHYCADITRTYPADGSFTPEQRRVYAIVERARAAAVDAVAPGRAMEDIHTVARGVLVEGLMELGVVSGTPEAIVEEKSYQEYFPHRTSHWLGLEVHDPGDYARDGASRPLEEGMVFTVEPGLYFSAEGGAADTPYAGIGVRIEDDVLVTADGHENLTGSLPTHPDVVEDLVSG